MTTPQPPRREQRKTHLDASVVPVERALLARAGQVGSDLGTVRRELRVHGITERDARGLTEVIANSVAAIVAAEFRALAEELHWV
jgi:hypothetical protein